jgi:isocitrate/isopropylmalate dehydrogenase
MSLDDAVREMASDPTRFGVVVACGLCGAMVASVGAGLAGGLRLAARMDVGTSAVVFPSRMASNATRQGRAPRTQWRRYSQAR